MSTSVSSVNNKDEICFSKPTFYLMVGLVILVIIFIIIIAVLSGVINSSVADKFVTKGVPDYLNSPEYASGKHEESKKLKRDRVNRSLELQAKSPEQTVIDKIKGDESRFTVSEENPLFKPSNDYDFNGMVSNLGVDSSTNENHLKYVKESKNHTSGAKVYGNLDPSQSLSWIGLRRPRGVHQSKNALFVTEVDNQQLEENYTPYML